MTIFLLKIEFPPESGFGKTAFVIRTTPKKFVSKMDGIKSSVVFSTKLESA
jgi:hypothetical protein